MDRLDFDGRTDCSFFPDAHRETEEDLALSLQRGFSALVEALRQLADLYSGKADTRRIWAAHAAARKGEALAERLRQQLNP